MLKTTEAIVLKTVTFHEADQMVTLLTPDLGKISGLARHGKKSQKRFGTVLHPFNILEIQYRYREGASLIFLEKASIKEPLTNIFGCFNSIVGAYYCVELMNEIVHEHDPNLEKYKLLQDILMQVNAESRPLASLLRWYEYHLLTLAGLTPEIRHCVKCHAKIEEDKEYQFVYWEGGLVCPQCYSSGKVSDSILGKFVLEFHNFIENFHQGDEIVLEKETVPVIRKILHSFIHYQLNKVLKSEVFINSIREFVSNAP